LALVGLEGQWLGRERKLLPGETGAAEQAAQDEGQHCHYMGMSMPYRGFQGLWQRGEGVVWSSDALEYQRIEG